MNRLPRHILLAVSFTTLFAGSVLAAPMPGYQGDCPMVQDGGQRADRMEQHRNRMVKRMEQHQQQLKTALKLTPAQEPAWQQFSEALKPHTPQGPQMDRQEWQKLTTPQRLEKLQTLKAERDARMRTHIEAIQKFYGSLNPEQQKTFDAQFMHFGQAETGPGPKMSR